MKQSFQITTSNFYPLGVHFNAEGLHIAAIFESKKECGIFLYDKQHKEGIKIPFPADGRKGNVYAMLLKGYHNTECSYLFYEGDSLLQDPYAKAMLCEKKYGQKSGLLSRCRVYSKLYDWEKDKNPVIPYEDSIFYLLHVRGFTKHSSSGVKAKGTYAGIIEKIPYLKELGITAVLLMPAYEFDEILLPQKRKTPATMEEAAVSYKETMTETEALQEERVRINYWGYQEGLYYLPKSGYAHTKDAVTEYKDMVKALHQNGIEVMMQFYFPPTVKSAAILDILKFWVLEYHIDGFHLMGAEISMEDLYKEPLLAETKLLSEKDVAILTSEQENSAFRNVGIFNEGFLYDTRKFLKGDDNEINSFIYHNRSNYHEKGVVNYIAKQDGFRLADMVSYDRKHNLANGEANQDGSDYNCSWNCGVEGTSRKKAVMMLRMRQMKNALTFVLLAQGTPLIYSGDEFGNTQEGNNNPYCQDNAIGWIKWNQQKNHQELLDYTKNLIAFRKAHSIFHARKPLRGMDYLSCGYPDISYHGKEAWRPDTSPVSRSIGMLYCESYGAKEINHSDELFYLGINMHWEVNALGLPKLPKGKGWQILFSTQAKEQISVAAKTEEILHTIQIPPRTIVMLGIKDMPEETAPKISRSKAETKVKLQKEQKKEEKKEI